MAITATVLDDAKLRADEVWEKGGQLRKAYETDAVAALAILQNQTAQFDILKSKDKDPIVQIEWMNPCVGTVVDCTPTCTISGSGVDTDVQDYALTLCKETKFSIGSEQFRTNRFDMAEAVSIRTMRAHKLLDEFLAQRSLAFLKANSGINFASGPYTYNSTNNTTYIADNAYNQGLIPYLELMAMENKMADGYKISNGEIYIPVRTAELNGGNAEGAGQAAMAAALGRNMYMDLFNFVPAGVTTEDMFLIEKGAVALITKSRFDPQPFYVSGTVQQWRWSEASRQLPGVTYDFYLQETCNASYSSTQEDIVTNIKAKVRYGHFLNPLGCTFTNAAGTSGQSTGIISITKGAVPA